MCFALLHMPNLRLDCFLLQSILWESSAEEGDVKGRRQGALLKQKVKIRAVFLKMRLIGDPHPHHRTTSTLDIR